MVFHCKFFKSFFTLFNSFVSVEVPGCEPYREYLYTYLRYQPIWQAIRFWNAAYFDAVQSERSHRPIPQTITVKIESDSSDEDLSSGAKSVQRHLARDVQTNLEMIKDDQEFQRNICFGQLGYDVHFELQIKIKKCYFWCQM